MRCPAFYCRDLDFKTASKTSSSVVRFRAIVIHEDSVVSPITEKRAAEFSDLRRCSHPARCFGVEISESLQLSILLFR